jgi:hypothetical protein
MGTNFGEQLGSEALSFRDTLDLGRHCFYRLFYPVEARDKLACGERITRRPRFHAPDVAPHEG